MGFTTPSRRSRRKVLKIIGGTAGISAGLSTTVSGDRGARIEGVAYDPKTLEILGEASGQFNSTQSELVGNLRIDGQKHNMNQAKLIKENQGSKEEIHQSYRSLEKPKSEEKRKGSKRYNKLIEITTSNEANTTGFIRTPDSLERVGFALTDNNTKHDEVLDLIRETRGDN